MMKKSCLWMPAAILACGLAASSCSKDDDPVTSADPAASAQQQTQYEEMPAQPTADQLTTKITRPTFVFAGDYTGEGKALVARAANAVGIDRAEVVIMPGAQVAGLTEEQLHSIVAVLANEGTVVFVEPEVDVIDDFCMKAAGVVGDYEGLFDAEDASPDALLRIMEWSEVSPFAALADEDGAKDCYEIIALRAKTVYASMNEREGTDSKQTINVEILKEGTEDEYESFPVEVEMDNDLSDYYFGEKADNLAEWINSEEPEVTEEEVTEARQIIQHRAAADAASLQNLSKSQTFIYDGTNSFRLTAGENGERTVNYNDPIQLRYEVWTAYAPDKKQDYYCVKLSVTAENEKLKCGPSASDKWCYARYDKIWGKADEVYKDKTQDDFIMTSMIYGPYMKELDIASSLDKVKASVVEYTPKNSTSGGVNTSESFSYSLGISPGFNMSGITGAATGSMTWGTSVSKFNPDLKAEVKADMSGGSLNFNYKTARPTISSKGWVFIDFYHTNAKDIATKTCTVQHAWVWSAQTDAAAVQLNTKFYSVLEWVSPTLKKRSFYLPMKKEYTFKSAVNCPPRFKQEWVMTVEPANKAVEDYLASHLKNDFIKNGTIWTRQEKHTAADTKDEISAWVAKSKGVFDKSKTVLKAAAEAGKSFVWGAQPFKIRWHQVNGTGNAADDFIYEAKW